MDKAVNKPTPSLSAAKKLLLQKRLRGAAYTSETERTIPRASRAELLPASFAQQRLWFLDQLAPGNPAYNIFEASRLKGPLNVAALEKSLAVIVQRHETIRTVFDYVNGQPVQVIRPEVPFHLTKVDLSSMPVVEREQEARRLMDQEAAKPFDLRRDVMLRAVLLCLGPEDHGLLITMHHIASDGWSLGVLYQELCSLYNTSGEGKTAELPELPIQYADFSVWQRRSLGSGALQPQLDYWKQKLAGAPELLELPTDHPRPASQSFRGATHRLRLPANLAAELKELGRREGVTLFMILLGAINTLLHRYSRQTDIVIGCPIAGRNHFQTEGLVGFFTSTLAMRTDLSQNPSFRELLRRVRETTLDAYANQDLPFDKLVMEVRPERSSSHSPIFQVAFAFQSGLIDSIQMSGLTISPMQVGNNTAKFDLTLLATETAEGMLIHFEYARDLFQPDTMARMTRQFQLLLEGVVSNPEQKLSELPLLTAADRQQLLVDWNQTQRDYPANLPVAALFEEQVQRRPRAIAVEAGRQHLSYAELNTRANQLAHELLQQGAGPGTYVGVYLERSLEMIVSFLAILKAGAAYVPLDRSYPKDRLGFMLQDAHIHTLLTQQRLVQELPPYEGAHTIFLDTEAREIQRQPRENPPSRATGEDLAYVIYTSGSTGQPKGACIPHRAIGRLVLNTDYVQLDENEVIAQVSNCSFDAATFEIWGALLNGGRLVIIEKDVFLSPPLFAREIERRGVTTAFITTALFNLFAREMPQTFKGMRQLLFGGEVADPQCVREILKAGPPARLLNAYGPTETTTFALAFPIQALPEGARTVPIGRPIANTELYVLDEYLQPVPVGVPGELYIGGPGVGQGYLNRPELTQEKFVPNPFRQDPKARLYRTGDLVKYYSDGVVEFLGRIDLQVKIRGFRVELGEIEAVLSRHPSVRECAVMVREDIPGQKGLVGYVVGADEYAEDTDSLSHFLKEHLPEYMVPSAFVYLPALPLNANGKVERKALPAPVQATAAGTRNYVAPRDELEKTLTAAWEAVLGRYPIGIRDNFFQLGGHSLLAVQLAGRLEKVLQKKVLVSTLFQAPTVERLAAALRGESQANSTVVPVQSSGSKPPLLLVHGVGGGMFWGYRNLSRYLGEDQPVYVLRSRAMDSGEEEFQSIEGMARQYVADLKSFQPTGPYYLGGYCFGGNVAFEMARQLTAQGDSVAILALMNCAPPNSSYARVRWTPAFVAKFLSNLAVLIGNAWQWKPEQRRDFLRWKLRLAKGRLTGWYQKRPRPRRHVQVEQLVDLSTYSEEQRRLWESHIQALLNFHPQPYSGQITLFRARAHPLLCSFDPLCGWGTLAKGGVLLKLVSGPHEGVLDEPHVQALAQELKCCLDKLHAKTPRPSSESSNQSDSPTLPPGRVGRAEESPAPSQPVSVPSSLDESSPESRFDTRMPRPAKARAKWSFLLLSPVWETLRQWRARHGAQFLTTLLTGLSIVFCRAGTAWHNRRECMSRRPEQTTAEDFTPGDWERQGIVVGWNATERQFPVQTLYPRLFETQALLTPEAPALRSDGKTLTYAQLEQRANQVAHLLQELNVQPDTLVGLYLERSPEYAVSLLGVLKAGAAFLPLDVDNPPARTRQIVADARPAVLITRQQHSAALQGLGQLVCLDDPAWQAKLEQADQRVAPPSPATCDSLAYVIYTSGSTGVPKGVEVTHRALLNHNYAVGDIFQLGPQDRILQMAALSFDLSLEEMLPGWLRGACVVFRHSQALGSTDAWLRFVEEEQITVLDLATGFWRQLVEDLPAHRWPASVRLVVIGGEKASQETYRAWKERAPRSVQLINTYGPTETTISATFAVADPTSEAPLTIGRPLPNLYAYVLDERLQPVPPGRPGELYLGGVGLARGYRNRPEVEARQFIPDPFRPGTGERLYRTGDRVCWRADGNLEFLGRLDEQVKIGGYRVEPAEVEAVLSGYPALQACAVTALPGPGGTARLVAYVVWRDSGIGSSGEVQAYLKKLLPAYMVPSAIVALDRLPLNSHGKLDQEALPAPAEEPYLAPRPAREVQLARIWREVLGCQLVDPEDRFLDLGGNSLHAMQIISRVRQLGWELPAPNLFANETLAALAACLGTRTGPNRRRKAEPIPPAPATGPWPLSPAQQRLWFVSQMAPESPIYNLPQAVRLLGKVNLEALQQALQEILRRQPTLRTTFAAGHHEPSQNVLPTQAVALPLLDLSAAPEPERVQVLNQRMVEEARQPFDLSRDLMLRAKLLRVRPTEHVLLLTFHHIAADAWSVNVFLEELLSLYESYSEGNTPEAQPLTVQYVDYALWQRAVVEHEVQEESLPYWLNQLKGAPALLELPADRSRPAVPSGRGARQRVQLNPQLTAGLQQLGQQEKATLFMTLLAAFKCWLQRYTGQEDLVVGTPVANRTRTEVEPIIGFFVNTLVLRTDTSGNPTFRELLARTRKVVTEAFTHQELAFDKLVEQLHPSRDPSYHPLFQTMFVLQEPLRPMQDQTGLWWHPLEVDAGTAKFDLTLEMYESQDGLEGWFEYATDLFDASRVQRMALNFQTLLEGIVADPDRPLSALSLLAEAERHRVLVEWNQTERPLPTEKALTELFETQVAAHPDATALVFQNQRLSYAELNRRANRLAHNLKALGVGPDVLVGVCLERSVELVVSILGVLKAGGAYVPMDPSYPAERLKYMLQDAHCAVLLTAQRLLDRLPAGTSKILCVEAGAFSRLEAAGADRNPVPAPRPQHLAYIIYTSGSTGRPKGVALEHHSVAALLHWAHELYSPAERKGVLFVTSICFDLSVFEMFVPLSWGGKIILADRPLEWTSLPAATEVTLVNTVPSVLSEWLRSGPLPSSVQLVNLAGEPLTQQLVDQIYQQCPSVQKVYDLYGPTEDTVYSTCALRKHHGRPTIGRPLSNEQLYLLDRHGNPVPIGVPGELFIGGVGLARGYLHQPELTAQKFVPNPVAPGQRVYRTGDLVRYLEDGNVEFLGRIDHQVKIRGYRIELGEIEQALRRHPRVQEAVVTARAGESGEKALVAYYVPKGQTPLETSEFRSFLKKSLPEFMVPPLFMSLPAFPMTPSGKIDRKALPAPERPDPELAKDFVAPSTDLELLLAGIWCELLKLDRVGIHHNFFELGGHSLMVTQLISRIREALELEVPMRVVFEAPTIAGLAQVLEKMLIQELEALSEEEVKQLEAQYTNSKTTAPEKGF